MFLFKPKIGTPKQQQELEGTKTRMVTLAKSVGPSSASSASKIPLPRRDTAATSGGLAAARTTPNVARALPPLATPGKNVLASFKAGSSSLHRTQSASAGTRAKPLVLPRPRMSSRIPTFKHPSAKPLLRLLKGLEISEEDDDIDGDFDEDGKSTRTDIPAWAENETLMRWYCHRLEACREERAKAFPRQRNPTAEEVFGDYLERDIIREEDTLIWDP